MALGFNVLMRNAMLDAITTFAGGSALIRGYSGTRPGTTGGSLSGNTLLFQLTCNATFAGAGASGVLTLNSITQDSSADATGTAAWFRMVKSDTTTHIMDGNIGTSGSDLNLNTTSIVSGGPVSITSFTLTAGNA